MFVKFSCGCVGLVGVQGVEEGHHLLIYGCDDDTRDLGLWSRNMSGKTHEPLPPEKTQKLVAELGRLLMDGHKFRQLKSLLDR